MGWAVFSSLLLLFALGLALQLYPVQNWLLGKLTSSLGEKSDFRTEI